MRMCNQNKIHTNTARVGKSTKFNEHLSNLEYPFTRNLKKLRKNEVLKALR